jgi:hypothetical protein
MVDCLSYFMVPVVSASSPLHQRVEYVEKLADFANRSMGGAFGNRPIVHPSKVYFVSAPLINISEKLPDFRADRKEAVAEVMARLEQSYKTCITEMSSLDTLG